MTEPRPAKALQAGRRPRLAARRRFDKHAPAPDAGARTKEAGGPARKDMSGASERMAVVVIGRNEGERLRASLRSVRRSCERVVYVDSGSTDGSAVLAAGEGVVVHALDPARPFSAARGRNEGFQVARERWPGTAYVQFVDGDCLLDEAWLDRAAAFLDAEPKVAMLCGDNEEEFPDASVYNRLCAVEWSGAPGEVAACGGNAVVRGKAFEAAGGYDDAIRAGEEPELCLRLRRAGWRVHRLPDPMTVHDADMHRFGEWWRRAERSGVAYWTGWRRHGAGPERYNAKETLRAILWGGALPLAALVFLFVWPPAAALILAIYAAKLLRVALRHRDTAMHPLRYAGFMMLSNVAEFVGIARGVLDRRGGAS